MVVEYDERNNFLMAIEITYNRREANKNFAYNYRELKDKIQQELDTAQVNDDAVMGTRDCSTSVCDCAPRSIGTLHETFFRQHERFLVDNPHHRLPCASVTITQFESTYGHAPSTPYIVDDAAMK